MNFEYSHYPPVPYNEINFRISSLPFVHLPGDLVDVCGVRPCVRVLADAVGDQTPQLGRVPVRREW